MYELQVCSPRSVKIWMDELHVDSKHAKMFFKKDRCILRGIFLANEIKFQTDDIEKLREARYSEKFPMKKIYQDFHLYISVKICWRFFFANFSL